MTWRHTLATAANDRAYGVVAGSAGGVVTAGYTRGDLDGAHPTGASDDGFVAGIDATGARAWTTQFGDPAAADRFYAVASDGAGGAFVAGYTSGSVAGPSAGDKDAVVAQVDRRRQPSPGSPSSAAPARTRRSPSQPRRTAGCTWAGSPAAPCPAAPPRAASTAGSPGSAPTGDVAWLKQHGTSDTDQVSGMAVRSDGTVIAVGHTGGQFGATAFGDKDAFAIALAGDGSELWATQLGTATDDRGVTAVARADGSVLLLGTTYGPVGSQVGGVDVFTAVLDEGGAVGERSQFGSGDRDGADEWDEANLYAAGAPDGSVLVSGLTFGAPDGQVNAGLGDVFTMTIAP